MFTQRGIYLYIHTHISIYTHTHTYLYLYIYIHMYSHRRSPAAQASQTGRRSPAIGRNRRRRVWSSPAQQNLAPHTCSWPTCWPARSQGSTRYICIRYMYVYICKKKKKNIYIYKYPYIHTWRRLWRRTHVLDPLVGLHTHTFDDLYIICIYVYIYICIYIYIYI